MDTVSKATSNVLTPTTGGTQSLTVRGVYDALQRKLAQRTEGMAPHIAEAYAHGFYSTIVLVLLHDVSAEKLQDVVGHYGLEVQA
jgi:hypothetical protein